MKENALTKLPRATAPLEVVPDVFQFEVLRKNSVWVFDDAAKGVQNEPFVCGMNEIIDGICRRFGIPPVDGQRILATFCDARAVQGSDVLERDQKLAVLHCNPARANEVPPDYTPYKDTVNGREGAFCPVFRQYFPVGRNPKVLCLLPEKVGP